MTSVITFSMLKGLLSGLAIGFFSKRVRSMPLGLLAGIVIDAILSLVVIRDVWRMAGIERLSRLIRAAGVMAWDSQRLPIRNT
jgi:hypothetical protein